jgi:vacuolar-type H+-ATPase subunit C/Vma6
MSDAYDYGNARVAARRGRLLAPDAIQRLAESGSPSAAIAQLERSADWRHAIDHARQWATEAPGVLETAIELHRATELAALPRWYDGAARSLVEALVSDLDCERVAAILRRRRAGQDAETINPSILEGALLDDVRLAELARATPPAAAFALLARLGLIDRIDAGRLAGAFADGDPAEFEAMLAAAWNRLRLRRAAGPGPDAEKVRSMMAEDARDESVVRAELAEGGAAGASLVERSLAFARLDRRAHLARREPDGIGPVCGYVAAIEAQTIRMRLASVRLSAGWTREVARSYLAAGVA